MKYNIAIERRKIGFIFIENKSAREIQKIKNKAVN